MAILSIQGVSFPVLIDSFMVGTERVGNFTRSVNGWSILERRREKQVFEFALAPKSLDEATMYRMLLLGEGEFWSTLTSAYGARGYALTGTGAWIGSGGGNPFSTNGVWRMSIGQTMIIPGDLYSQTPVAGAVPGQPVGAGRGGVTVIGWRRDDAGGTWRIFGWSWPYNHGLAYVTREKNGALGASGAAQAYSGGETFADNSNGSMKITEPGAGGPWSFSNLRLLPWFFPAAQVDALMDGFALVTTPLPSVPRVHVLTDLLPAFQVSGGQASLIMTGELTSAQLQPHWLSGAFTKTAMGLAGRLIEV